MPSRQLSLAQRVARWLHPRATRCCCRRCSPAPAGFCRRARTTRPKPYRARRRRRARGWPRAGSRAAIRSARPASIRFRRSASLDSTNLHGKARSHRGRSVVPGAVRLPGDVPAARTPSRKPAPAAPAAVGAADCAPAPAAVRTATPPAPAAPPTRCAAAAGRRQRPSATSSSRTTPSARCSRRAARALKSWRLKRYRDDSARRSSSSRTRSCAVRRGRSRSRPTIRRRRRNARRRRSSSRAPIADAERSAPATLTLRVSATPPACSARKDFTFIAGHAVRRTFTATVTQDGAAR